MTRETLTVVVPTKNVVTVIEDCLASVSFADAIIVVDMHSTDGTQAICKRFKQCRVIEREDYIFGNMNHGFEQATTDWVMRLDSDERLTPALVEEVCGILEHPDPDVTGYEFRQRPFVLGTELQHGFGKPHHRKMMFRRGAARYPVRSEHEDLETTGLWRKTTGAYVHLNYTSISQYLSKMDYYASRDAERIPLPHRPPSVYGAIVEVTRAFYLWYLRLAGFRDGWVGFVDAGMRATYQFVYWAKVRERWHAERGMS